MPTFKEMLTGPKYEPRDTEERAPYYDRPYDSRDDRNDKFYTDPDRYGPRNLELRTDNFNRDLSGMRGYPSNPRYMRLVGQAGTEAQQARMRATAEREGGYGSEMQRWAKPDTAAATRPGPKGRRRMRRIASAKRGRKR